MNSKIQIILVLGHVILTDSGSQSTRVTFLQNCSDYCCFSQANGFVRSTDVLAIMGASGAGKTTLLNALTMRNRGNFIIQGDIKVNGAQVKNFKEISSISGYVQQEDLFVGYVIRQSA